MESAWSNGKPAYRCRYGHTSAMPPAPDRAGPKNAYIREDRILPRLPALHLLLTGAESGGERRRRRTRRGTDVRPATSPQEAISYLREHQITLTWDQAAGTLQAGTGEAAKTLIRKAS
jgi:site-specific DNA recombinase